MPAVEFDALMRTPGDLDLEAAAALFSNPYLKVTDPAELSPALDAHRTGLIEIVLPTD